MPSFKKKNFTEPIVCKHDNDILKDWYVFFRYKHEGKVYKFKRREGVNRIKQLNEKLEAIQKLCDEIEYDLRNGWNPLKDVKRENDYNPYLMKSKGVKIKKSQSAKQTKQQLFNKYYLK